VAERSDVLAALDWARASGDTESMVRLVAALKKRFWYASGGLRTGLDWLEVAVQAGSQVPRLRAKVLQRAAWFAWELGLRERSRTLFEQSLATADESDHDSRVEALMGLCYHELRQPSPDLDRVEARLQDALREAQRTGKLGDLVEPLSTAGFLAELRGDQALARQHFEEAVAVARKCDDAWAIGTALFRLAGLDLAVGDVEQAMSRLADSAELSAQSGDLELYSRATLHLAQLETDRGALADARAHLLGGAAAARDIGTSWEQQLVLDAAALWLVAVGSTPDWGDSVGGRGLAEAAAAAVEAVEAVELTDLPAPAALRERFRLTDREWEVLALVAAGRSDGEIADQLVISKKTASVHVANIKGKLGAASRVEVATIALRAGVG